MAGYVIAHGYCFGCGALFGFNPVHVPSIGVHSVREPVCRACVERVNPERIRKGLAPIVPHPEAYEPCSEIELHYD